MDEAEPGLSRALGGLGSRERDFINSLSSLWAALCVLPSYHSFLVLFFVIFLGVKPSKMASRDHKNKCCLYKIIELNSSDIFFLFVTILLFHLALMKD